MIAVLCALASVGLFSLQSVEEAARIRGLAVAGDATDLATAVAELPDASRETMYQLLRDAAVTTDSRMDNLLRAAGKLATAYAAAWQDSFFVRQVVRFHAWSPEERRRKVRSDSLRRAGNGAFRGEGLDAAVALWRESIQLAQTQHDTSGIARSLGNIGAAYRAAGRADSSQVLLMQAYNLATATGDLLTAANAITNVANLSRDEADLPRSAELYTEALRIREKTGDERGAASDRHNLGLVYRELGDAVNARRLLQAAFEANRRHGYQAAAADDLVELAEVQVESGEYADASRGFEMARRMYGELGDEAGFALVASRAGMLELRRGSYREAERLLRASLSRYESLGRVVSAARVGRDLARAYMALGDLEAARRTLERAEGSVSGTQAGPQLEADLALARADLHVYLNESAKAAVHFERAAGLYLENSDEARYREATTGAASLLIVEGNHERAIRVLQKTLAGQEGNVDPRSVARTRLLLAYAQEQSGDVADARRSLETALRDLGAVGDVVGRAAALTAAGDLEARQGASSSAKAFYRAGLEGVAALEAPETKWRLYAGLGQILWQEGDLAAAERQLRAAIQQVEDVAPRLPELGFRESFFSDKWEVFAMLARVQVERGGLGAAFETSERLRAQTMLALLDRGRFGSRQFANTALAEREQDQRRYVLHLSSRDVLSHRRQEPTERGSRNDYTGHVQAVESFYADLLRQMAEQDPEYPRLTVARRTSWPAVARKLGDDVALVEYLVSDSTTLAFIVTSDTLAAVDLGLPRIPLADLVQFTRGAIDQARKSTEEETWRVPLQRLYQRLIAPVEATGLLTAKNRLLIAAHDLLHYVPFQALLTTHGGQFLSERYALSYVPSGSIWMQLRDDGESRPEDRILVLSPNLDGLPGTREEVRAIVRLYGRDATILTGAMASEASFKSSASSYDILHLGTAGALNQLNPLFSHIALAPADGEDGRLEVHEVFGLDLDGQLVVLSACETGLAAGALADVPAGDDWIGLSRAFLTAGASAVLATLWRVDDRSSARLTGRFYGGLRDGMAPDEALRAAQLALLRDPDTASPYYWAAFSLIGGL